MNTLSLNVIRIWFDMIYERIKPEEYRKISPYWCSRFLLIFGHTKSHKVWANWHSLDSDGCLSKEDIGVLERAIKAGRITYKKFKSTTFSNGMTPPVPRFEIEFLGFEIREGRAEWGAKEGVKYFVLNLGKIIEK